MITAIIQARVGSTRLPNKIFYPLLSKPIIWHVYNRLLDSKYIENIIIATTRNVGDDKLFEWCNNNKINVFRGNENNVLKRYYEAALKNNASIIVRITSDDPFKDINIIDKVIKQLIDNNLDFSFNNSPPTFPEGLDVEVFKFKSLKKAYLNASSNFEKEHVTQYFFKKRNLFKMMNLKYHINYSFLRLTVDCIEDYNLSKKLYKTLESKELEFNFDNILSIYKNDPDLFLINKNVERSDMYKKNEKN